MNMAEDLSLAILKIKPQLLLCPKSELNSETLKDWKHSTI